MGSRLLTLKLTQSLHLRCRSEKGFVFAVGEVTGSWERKGYKGSAEATAWCSGSSIS